MDFLDKLTSNFNTIDFDQKKFYVMPNVIEPHIIQNLVASVEQLHVDFPNVPNAYGTIRQGGLIMRAKIFRNLILSPTLHQNLSSYFGSDYYHLSAFQTNTVKAGSGGLFWHRDHPHRFISKPRHRSAIHIFFALHDLTEESGTTFFLNSTDPEEHMRLLISSEKVASSSQSGVDVLRASAGSVIIYDGGAIHTSSFNKTSKDRHLLIAQFVSGEILPQEDQSEILSFMTDSDRLRWGYLFGDRHPKKYSGLSFNML